MRERTGQKRRRAALAALVVAAFGLALDAEAATGTPPEAAALAITRAADGEMVLSGTVPEGLSPRSFAGRLTGRARLGEVSPAGTGTPARWLDAAEALNVVLPRIGVARIELSPGRVAIRGRLKPGVSLKEVRPALRAALGQGWTLVFEMTEVPPPAAIAFRHDAAGTRVSGMLPAGVSVAQALTALHDAENEGLATGASGAPGPWVRALATLDALLTAYRRAEGRLSPAGGLEIDGRLAPGHAAGALEAWAEGELPDGWPADVAGRETPAAEGATRIDPGTRRRERLVGGRWLADYDFPPTARRCAEEARAIQAARKLRFGLGAETLGRDADPVLDRLAGLAQHCLDGTGITLEIGGHTDALGDSETNHALSWARAEAVRSALARRGAPEGRMTARGHGADRPIASNETEEGRALNRRIDFDWRAPGQGAEGIEQALDR